MAPKGTCRICTWIRWERHRGRWQPDRVGGSGEETQLRQAWRERQENGALVVATEAEKATDYQEVKKRKRGYAARVYKKFTKLDMTQLEIDRLLSLRTGEAEAAIRRNFKGYDKYPEPAKCALLDMVFNLGITGVLRFTKKFTAAVRVQNWKTAAKESKRSPRQVGKRRNELVKKWFEAAATPPKKTRSVKMLKAAAY